MAESYSYHGRVRQFTNGVTTFDTLAVEVHTKGGSIDGPEIITHIVRNAAGAIIDLDGTGPATRVPPVWVQSFIFRGNHPDDHAQYKNLIKLKGEHGTLTVAVPQASATQLLTATARLIKVSGNWEGAHRAGTEHWIPITAEWQLKTFLST